MRAAVDRRRRTLLKLYSALGEADRATLLAFAEFLHGRRAPHREAVAAPLDPLPIPRPPEESVIGAIKRLSATYPMLDKDAMLHQVSGLMAQHVMQGRAAAQVIDELEAEFRRRYEALRAEPSKE